MENILPQRIVKRFVVLDQINRDCGTTHPVNQTITTRLALNGLTKNISRCNECQWRTNTVRFYALGLFIILLVCGQLQFNTDLMWRSVFPTIRSMYWFITIYAILYIFSGYLSRFLGHLRRAQAVSFIALGVLIFMVLPTFLKGWGSQLTDLLPVFFFGLYLRMYGVSKRLTTLLKVLLGVTVVIAGLSIGLSDMIGNNRPESQAIADATSYFVTGG